MRRIKLKASGRSIDLDDTLPIKEMLSEIPPEDRGIKICCTAKEELPVESFREFQGDLKTLPEENKRKLVFEILTNGWVAPLFLWDHAGERYVLDGQQRILATLVFREAGWTVPPLPVVFVEADTEKQAAEILLALNSHYGVMTQEGFEEYVRRFEIDAGALENLELPQIDISLDDLFGREEEEEEEVGGNISKVELSELDVEQEIMRHDRFYFSFSGGRDSALALAKTWPKLRAAGKTAEALFVETGAEFPDLYPYIYRVTSDLGIPLKFLPARRNFFDVYCGRGKWPDSIFRDCIETLISSTLDRYCQQAGEPYVLIRGGRAKQKTSRSTSDVIQKVQDKPLLTIYNPLQKMSQATYDAEIQSIPVWRGYAKGFVRTACWCCPFQTEQQWEALKTHYPLLWEEMRILVKTLHFKKHKGDTYPERIRSYWGTIQ